MDLTICSEWQRVSGTPYLRKNLCRLLFQPLAFNPGPWLAAHPMSGRSLSRNWHRPGGLGSTTTGGIGLVIVRGLPAAIVALSLDSGNYGLQVRGV